MSRTITVNTVQGIGDIFWVYQKLAPYVDTINWRIWVVSDSPVQYRSREFLSLLPKTGTVKFPLVELAKYHELARTSHPLQEVLKHDAVNYAVNYALEQGNDFYTMDYSYTPLARVELRCGSPRPIDDVLCLFVSGSRLDYVWSTEQWASHTDYLLRVLGLSTVVVIGADWDQWAANEVSVYLQRMGHNVVNYCKQLNLAETIKVIRSSYFFFGYQSGLGVLAENYNVPQLMVYFPFLRNMMYTWAKPDSRHSRYHAMTFDEADPETNIARAAISYRLEGRRSAQNV